MHILLVVDLQREFVKDAAGEDRYRKSLEYIKKNRDKYDCVIAFVYRNDGNPNMKRLVGWEDVSKPMVLEFKPDRTYFHSGYSVHKHLIISESDTVDVFGFDTDACVLAACFELFDLKCNFRILSDLCWSSGGEAMHTCGLSVMSRQFRRALSESNV